MNLLIMTTPSSSANIENDLMSTEIHYRNEAAADTETLLQVLIWDSWSKGMVMKIDTRKPYMKGVGLRLKLSSTTDLADMV